MPAYSDKFPWPPCYGHFKFFENQMRGHGRVADLTAIDRGVYELTLVCGKALRIFVCECYSYDVAEFIETTEAIGEFDAIIINSSWCGYTIEAKRLCRDRKVALFKIREFMTALHRPEIWSYLTEQETEEFRKRGRLG